MKIKFTDQDRNLVLKELEKIQKISLEQIKQLEILF